MNQQFEIQRKRKTCGKLISVEQWISEGRTSTPRGTYWNCKGFLTNLSFILSIIGHNGPGWSLYFLFFTLLSVHIRQNFRFHMEPSLYETTTMYIFVAKNSSFAEIW